MAANARFAVAVHTLGMLAVADAAPVTSERIAASINTNAVTVRRIFQALGQAGLVIGQMGPNGGARLARAPRDIDLAAVWRAVGDGALFTFPPSGGNPNCAISCAVRPVLSELFDEAQLALEQALATVTLAEVLARVNVRLGASACEQRTSTPGTGAATQVAGTGAGDAHDPQARLTNATTPS